MTSNVCLLAIEMTTFGKCELTMESLKGTSIINLEWVERVLLRFPLAYPIRQHQQKEYKDKFKVDM
jgi:hypothetical protein